MNESAEKLTAATNSECLPLAVDVRNVSKFSKCENYFSNFFIKFVNVLDT